MTKELFNKIQELLANLLNNILIDLDYGKFNTSIDYDYGVSYNYKEYEEDTKVTDEININLNFIDDNYSLEISKYNNNDKFSAFNSGNSFINFCNSIKLDIEQDSKVFSKTTKELIDKIILIQKE